MKAALVLGTQLFDQHPAFEDPDIDLFILIESDAAFRRRRYHSHKIVLLLAGMRHTADRLRSAGRRVACVPLDRGSGFIDGLRCVVRDNDVDALAWMSATDRGIDRRLLPFASAKIQPCIHKCQCRQHGIQRLQHH